MGIELVHVTLTTHVKELPGYYTVPPIPPVPIKPPPLFEVPGK